MRQHVITLIKAGLVPMLEGPPGSGKTAILADIAKELKMDFIPIVMSVMEPIDPMGLPTVANGKAKFLPFGLFEQVYNVKKPTLVLLDDLGQSAPSVQAATMQLIHGGQLNGHRVSEKVRFCIATNRPKDRAGVQQVISPIRGRVQTLRWTTECTCTGDGSVICRWHDWAARAGIHPAVAGFAKFRPKCMAEYDEPNVNYNAQVCSPRALEFLSKAEYEGIHDPVEVLVEAIIGAQYAMEYVAFRTMFRSLPLIDEIVARPQTAMVPLQMDQLIAVSVMLSHNVDKKTCEAAMAYVTRLPVEISTAFVMTTKNRVPEITQCRPFAAWAHKSAPHLLAA